MSTYSTCSRRNFWIRTIGGITGDVAIGLALSGACIWIIQGAALGLFLSFLAWLVTLLLSLALSQVLVHPTVQFALSDHKLDHGIEALASLGRTASGVGRGLGSPVWNQLRRRVRHIAAGFAAA